MISEVQVFSFVWKEIRTPGIWMFKAHQKHNAFCEFTLKNGHQLINYYSDIGFPAQPNTTWQAGLQYIQVQDGSKKIESWHPGKNQLEPSNHPALPGLANILLFPKGNTHQYIWWLISWVLPSFRKRINQLIGLNSNSTYQLVTNYEYHESP